SSTETPSDPGAASCRSSMTGRRPLPDGAYASGQQTASVLVVLPGTAPDQFGRVLLLVLAQLRLKGGGHVDPQATSQQQQVELHVGYLVGDLALLGLAERQRLLWREPLEVLGKLADLAGQRHHQVLGRV